MELIYGVKEKDGMNLEKRRNRRIKKKGSIKREKKGNGTKNRQIRLKKEGVVIIKWECERCGALKSLEQQGGVG